jgi:hypothetical protein
MFYSIPVNTKLFDETEECKEIVRNFEYENKILKSRIEQRYFEIKKEILEDQRPFSEEARAKSWWLFWK